MRRLVSLLLVLAIFGVPATVSAGKQHPSLKKMTEPAHKKHHKKDCLGKYYTGSCGDGQCCPQ